VTLLVDLQDSIFWVTTSKGRRLTGTGRQRRQRRERTLDHADARHEPSGHEDPGKMNPWKLDGF